MTKFLRFIKFLAIWIVVFFLLNVAAAIILPSNPNYISAAVSLISLVSTIVSSKFAPLHGLYGCGWRTFTAIIRYILDFMCYFVATVSILYILHIWNLSTIKVLLEMSFSFLMAYLTNRSELNIAYKHLNEISFPRKNHSWRHSPSTARRNPGILPAPSMQSSPPVPPPPQPQQTRRYTMARIDAMSGHEFEHFTADLLKKLGYINVKVTPGSGDQGVDVLAERDGIRYAFQCKCYSSDLGNTPVQEVHAGKYIYQCHVGVVITNRYFTQGAKDAAKATGILLWDRDKLQSLIQSAS